MGVKIKVRNWFHLHIQKTKRKQIHKSKKTYTRKQKHRGKL